MTVLTALAGYYDRLAARGEASEPGYAPAKISFEIVLRPDGGAELGDLRSVENGKPRPRHDIGVPEVARTSGICPAFLWDKSAYVLGLIAEKGADGVTRPAQGRRTSDEHTRFKGYHEDALGGTEDDGLLALLSFLRSWTPDKFASLGWSAEALDSNFVFRLDGDRNANGQRRFLHDRPEARRIWAKLNAPAGSEHFCLVTGARAPMAETHTMIKGVVDAQSSGAAIVSFNAPAFASFGKEQGANAPVSERAAFAYTTALNALLANARRRIRVGDATAVFWADAAGTSEDSAAAAEDLFAAWSNPAGDDPDVADFAAMRAAMEAVADGRGWAGAPHLDPRTRLHFLGLAPNNARLAVRFWHVGSFGEFAGRLAAHYRDLEIEPAPFVRPPKFGAWLFETAVLRKAENIPPLLGGEFMRAILTGGRYPRTLLSAVIGRVRADGALNGARAALCKAVINRDVRLTGKGKEVPVALDRENDDAAYRLGRLFALLERAQTLALPGLNATIRDRYFAGASATPQRIFPTLLRNAQNHIASVRKSDKSRLAPWLDREIGEIWAGLKPDLPRALRLEDQGRFFAGYYHQRFGRQDKTGAENPIADAALEPTRSKED